jgi:flagellar hook-associated protein 2
MTSALSFQNSSTNSSGLSFQGISSGIQTSQLVQAEISQASLPLQQLQTQQTANNSRSSALTSLEGMMTSLSSSIDAMNNSGFPARLVTSTDTNNTYVTATASGGASGSYTLQVQNTATAAEIAPTLDSSGNPTNFSTASATAPVFTGTGSASFALEDTNGNIRQFTLDPSNNNINGLANAINALQTADPSDPTSKALGIQATVVNTGNKTPGANPYELILTSTTTGSGTAGANISIADTTAGGAVNSIGIAAGSVSGSTLAGGTASTAQPGTDAQFTLDGVQLTRSSNTVSDAINGVTFNLLQGNQSGTTTLTVAPDVQTATIDMQAVVSSYNTMIQTYTTDAAQGGALNGDFTSQSLVNQISQALTGTVAGLPASATYNSASSLGLSTNEDGTLSLDTTKFGDAFQANPTAAMNVFATSGTSTSASVSLAASGPSTASGNIGFNITSYTNGGAVTGTVTAPDGTQYNLTGNNGILEGASGTPLAGLYLSVTGTGSGTLTLSKGVGQAAEDTITNLTAPSNGTIAQVLTDITNQNSDLATQIADQQAMLTRMQTSLENQYSAMEATLSQLQAAGQSINSLG